MVPERWLIAIEYVTGAAGPLQRMFSWLRRHGIGERVIKSAIAAVLAWWLARLIPHNEIPTFAPLSALFAVNLTIAGSMRGAGQRVIGMVFGLLLAVLASSLFGNTGLMIGVVILIGFAVGHWMGLDALGVQQIGISALLVVLGAAGTSYNDRAWLHLVNTLIGTLVGLLLNASVAPTNLLPDARERLLETGESMRDDLELIAAELRAGVTHVSAVALLQQTRRTNHKVQLTSAALERAEESLRYNLQARSLRATLEDYLLAELSLRHASIHTRMISRALSDATGQQAPQAWLAPEALGGPLAELIDLAYDAVTARTDRIRAGTIDVVIPMPNDPVMRCQDAILQAAQRWETELAHGGIFYMGEIVALSVQLITEMSDLRSVDPYVPPAA